MSKKFITLLVIIFLTIFINKTIYAQEPGQILLINQVRGEECCQKGSLLNLEKQIETFNKYEII